VYKQTYEVHNFAPYNSHPTHPQNVLDEFAQNLGVSPLDSSILPHAQEHAHAQKHTANGAFLPTWLACLAAARITVLRVLVDVFI
jgi:hypothetical protein